MKSPATRILAGLAVGTGLGAAAAAAGIPLERPLAVAGTIGGLWLDALRMTVVPLVFALVVTGIAAAAAHSRAGGLTRRAILLFVPILLGSALVAAFVGPVLLGAWSPPADALAALRAGAEPVAAPAPGDWLGGLVPTNVIASAAAGAIVPLTLFALLFGLAASRLPDGRGAPVIALFEAVKAAMLEIVRWVLLIAPLGVLALGFGVGARLGLGAGAALAHYVAVQILVTLLLGLAMYPLAAVPGRVPLGRFARAAVPAQAVAFSTQSSLAALPPMVGGAARIGVAEETASVVLPLAVALFRIAAPASIVIVALTLARLNGVEIGWPQMAIVVGMATVNTLVIAGLPNQITFFAAYAPPAMAVGVPVELLPLLLAVDTIPDMFYTVSNVTADLAVTTVAARDTAEAAPGDS